MSAPAGQQQGERAPILVALLLGVVAFLVVRGPATLDPTNIHWVDAHDRAMHTLGWWFFRAAPWGWPPGASPGFGLEYANSVALADSLPLLAFPFKLLSPLLPEHFQYWGWWQLLSFALQALFAVLIAHELRLGRALALVAALFCLFQPAFLARLDPHIALSAHWFILAAIWLYLRQAPPPRWAWPLLLFVAAASHGYLMVMVFAIWLASGAQRLWLGRLRPRSALFELALGAAAIALALWATGILMVGSVAGEGFGSYRMNLLGPLNPDGWSSLVPGVASSFEEWEGFNFVGLGFALLAIAGLAGLDWKQLAAPRLLPLAVAAVGLAVFALSNRVALGSIELFAIPLPDWLARIAGIFRSSGRMFWPLGYLLIFAVLVAVSRRFPARWAIGMALACVALQIGDSHVGWRQLRVGPERSGSQWSTPLVSPAWAALAPHYQRVRALPVAVGGPNWRELSLFAVDNAMGTDAAMLTRVDPAALQRAVERGHQSLADGSFDSGAIYALDDASAALVAAHLAPGDLLARIDGLIVFARGGGAILNAAGIQTDPRDLP